MGLRSHDTRNEIGRENEREEAMGTRPTTGEYMSVRSGEDTKQSGELMSLRNEEAPAVKGAWAHASRLSADGLLHDAVMVFLRIRTLLRRHSSKPAGSGAPPGFRKGLGGKGARATQTAAGTEATVGASSHVQAGVGSVITKLLEKVDEEIKSHIQFLRGNHYAALQLPAPQHADRSSLRGAITDRIVKGNYRRLALRFHPDKTGEADSSILFATVRAAYENLATPRHRTTYKPAIRSSTSREGSDGDFRWEVDIAGATSKGGGRDLPAATLSGPASYCSFPNPSQTKRGERLKPHDRRGDYQDGRVPVGGDCIGTPDVGVSCGGPWRSQGVGGRGTDVVGEERGQEKEGEGLGVEVEVEVQEQSLEEKEGGRGQGRSRQSVHEHTQKEQQQEGGEGQEEEEEEQEEEEGWECEVGEEKGEEGRQEEGKREGGQEEEEEEEEEGGEEEEEQDEEEDEEDEEDEEGWEWEDGGEQGKGHGLLGSQHGTVESQRPMVDAEPNQPVSRPRVEPRFAPSVDGKHARLDTSVPATTETAPRSPPAPTVVPRQDQQLRHTSQRNTLDVGPRGKSTSVTATAGLGVHPPLPGAMTIEPPSLHGAGDSECPSQFEHEASQDVCPASLGESPRHQRLGVGASCTDGMVGRDDGEAGVGAGGCGDWGAVKSGSRCVRRLRKSVAAREGDHGVAVCQSPAHAHFIQQEVDFWVCGARNTKGRRRGGTAASAPLRGDASQAVERGTCRRGNPSSTTVVDVDGQPVQNTTSVPGRRFTSGSTLGTAGEAYRSGCGGAGNSQAQSSAGNFGPPNNSSPPHASSGAQSATQGVRRRRRARTTDPFADPFPEDSTLLRFDDASYGVQDAEKHNSSRTDGGGGTWDDLPPTFRTDGRSGYTDLAWCKAGEREMMPKKTGFTESPENLGLGFGLGLDRGDCRPLPLDAAESRILGDRLAGEPAVVGEAAGNPLVEDEGLWVEVENRPHWRGGDGQGWFWGAPRDS